MPFKFAAQPLQTGLYEPEGIYLHPPFAGKGIVLQSFGEDAVHYGQYTYNGVPLRGHNGVDFGVGPTAELLAVDAGRVVEISYDLGGLERYIKVEHRWGESVYALIGDVNVDSGHHVKRGDHLGRSGATKVHDLELDLLHFGVRVAPFNRFDGWGGFSNPLLFLNPSDLTFFDNEMDSDISDLSHPLVKETPKMRRP